MSWFKRYIAYYKHNPEGYWFKRRLYGWGWVPVTWQGWLVVAVVAAVFATGLYSGVTNGAPSTILIGLALGVVLIFIFCYAKGEKPAWMWGLPKEGTDAEETNTARD